MTTCMAFIGGFSYMELAFAFIVVLILFGPRKLPEIYRTMSKVMTQLRSASQEFKSQMMEVEAVVREEVREIEKTIQEETDEIKDDLDYNFDEDPYHADMDDDHYHDPYHDENGNPIDPDAHLFEEKLLKEGVMPDADELADESPSSDSESTDEPSAPEGTVSAPPPRSVPEAEVPDFLKLDRVAAPPATDMAHSEGEAEAPSEQQTPKA